ncbi:MAG: monovalent cation/H(+) antiporter subunit G [Variovorax sp.]|nr:monovalent cation/H(+) antiporter subunit G [Variovorax sp.]
MVSNLVGTPLPLWAEILTAVCAVCGAAFAAIGSFGLVRCPTFFRRIHPPTLGATLGVWSITLATIIYFSVQGGSLFLHAALIALFVAMTAPVTTIFLMRAALFRERIKGGKVPSADATPPR